ncbi:MAG: ATP-dependent DNA helicase RecG [Firmicutes bacterium]|nr:ATP-dependent DNA helicase RecG [Bacillota bacterium]
MLLTDDIGNIKNIGTERRSRLNKMGVYTVLDMLEYFPRDYEDRSVVTPVAEITPGSTFGFVAKLDDKPTLSVRGRLKLVRARVSDGTGQIDVIWYNQPYLKNSLQTGKNYWFFGKAAEKFGVLQVESPEWEPYSADKVSLSNGRIIPVYPLTQGLTQKVLRGVIKQTLDDTTQEITDHLPADIIKKYGFIGRREAVKSIHFPESDEMFFKARQRLVFDELFLLQMRLLQLKGNIKKKHNAFEIKNTDISPVLDVLGFELTAAQKKVLDEIRADIESGFVMNRLIQGDVGSGKTAVALAAAYMLISNGYQVALMAPTDVLASQHYESISRLFAKLGIRTELLKSGMKKSEKDSACENIRLGLSKMIIGTHALIQDRVEYRSLALVITDEQHRFGVEQRRQLEAKGETPHVLVMTATPIPRTLGLILYGDLDISTIDHLPPGRQKIDTYAVNTQYHERLYAFIKKLAAQGRQCYMICPMIEENEKNDMRAAVEYTDELKSVFPELEVACLHGKMKAAEKQAVMDGFYSGKTDVLVATTVIEVGVNVPNATIMVVENAERFGLSALHQLRGRVGRGSEKSYCILVSDSKNKLSKERLQIMCSTDNGFEISEKDLQLRGPGDFFGTRQHGLPEMKIANLYKDIPVLKQVQEAATQLYLKDPMLILPENRMLKQKILDIFDKNEKNLGL